MGLNLDIIGRKSDPAVFKYDEDRVILYALGIGAGVDELDFVYEKSLRVYPTFAVIPGLPAFAALLANAGLNLPTVLHGEHKIILHGEIPTSGTIYTTGECKSMYDKGNKGAFINAAAESRDENGRLLFENHAVIVDRSAGNFSGERGPKTERLDPPEGKEPDFRVEYVTSPNQGALYRLSGDKNPLHIDPDFARLGGFDRPILHGLCTFGFAARAILNSVCEGDPARFKSFWVRFTGVVFPGDTIITKGWKIDQGRYIIQTITQDGRVVLGNAKAEVV